MERFLSSLRTCVCLLAGMLLFAAAAHGQSPIGLPSAAKCAGAPPPIPVQSGTDPAYPGLWWNPNRYGTGWNFEFPNVSGAEFFATWYTYDGNGRPIWLTAQSDASQTSTGSDGSKQYWGKLQSVAFADGASTRTVTAVGTLAVSFVPGSVTQAAVRWQWDAIGPKAQQDECVYNFFQPTVRDGTSVVPSGHLNQSLTGAWYDPKQSGWGMLTTVSPNNVETSVFYLYDSAGQPVWFIGVNANATFESQSYDLVFARSNYPRGFPINDCATRKCTMGISPTAPIASRVTRTFTSYQTGTLTFNANVPAYPQYGEAAVDWPAQPTFGGKPRFYAPADLVKLTDVDLVVVDKTTCIVPTGSSCAVTVSWSTVHPTARLYARDLNTDTLSAGAISSDNNGSLTLNLTAGSLVRYELWDGGSTAGTPTGGRVFASSSVRVIAGATPAAPSSVSVPSAPASGTFTVSWAASASIGTAAATMYRLSQATSSTGPWTSINDGLPSASTAYTVTVPGNGTWYFEVAACNAYGCSPYSVSNGAAVSLAAPTPPASDAPAIATPPARDAASDEVGATAAQFRVDEGGNATYSIPIQLPPGTAGMAPKLALGYNSRQPTGVMGPGWTIEGASGIARCRQTRESGDFFDTSGHPIDGNPPAVDFTPSDRFCLDGVRLLLLPGNTGAYGDSGTVYSPENDPTTLVTAFTSSTNGVGPDGFLVQRKDGTRSFYGKFASPDTAASSALVDAVQTLPIDPASPDAPAPTRTVHVAWNLARVQDSAGNYVDYGYLQQPAKSDATLGALASASVETVLIKADYTGHAGTPASAPYAHVVFTYVTVGADGVRVGYQSGVGFLQSQQLTGVLVSEDTAGKLRHYRLQYRSSILASAGSGSAVPRLSQVRECRDDSTAAVCYAPTTFEWSQANAKLVAQDGPVENPSAYMTALVGLKVADIDGDGRQDIVWATNDGSCAGGASRLRVGFLNGTAGPDQLDLREGPCAPINLANNDRAWYFLDYDGDGRADLLIGGAPGSTWAIYRGLGRSGSVFDTSTNLIAPLAIPVPKNDPNAKAAVGLLADVNGDGLPDFISAVDSTEVKGDVDTVARVMMRQADGTFAFGPPAYVSFNPLPTASDGSNDCNRIISKSSGNTVYQYCSFNLLYNDPQRHSAIVTDVNGDGRADLTLIVQVNKIVDTSGTCPRCVAARHAWMTFDATLGETPAGPADVSPPATPLGLYWYQFTAAGATMGTSGTALQFDEFWHEPISGPKSKLTHATNDFFAVDLTGDGLTDILYRDKSGSGDAYDVLVNTGSGYLDPVQIRGIENGDKLQLLDMNGDGKTDIVYYDVPTPCAEKYCPHVYHYVSLNPDGSGGWTFTSPAAIDGWQFPGDSGSVNWLAMAGDFDGDGVPDVFTYEFHPKDGAVIGYHFSRPAGGSGCPATNHDAGCSRYHPRDVIVGIRNGLGATTSLAYQPLTNKGVYEWGYGNARARALSAYREFGYGSPVLDVVAPIYVVAQASSSAPQQNAPDALSTVHYRYAGALMQAGGRGFLGFAQTWALDANDVDVTGHYIVTVNQYFQNYPFIGLPQSTKRLAFPKASTASGWTFGSEAVSGDLDACAQNSEAAGFDCFAPIGERGWPDLAAGAVTVGVSLNQPGCNGPGCSANPYLATCANAVGSAPSAAKTAAMTSAGLFSPRPRPAPLFSHVVHSVDAQYDLETGAPTAQTDVYSCYEDAYADLTHSNTITSDGVDGLVAQKLLANTYDTGAATLANWYLGRLTASATTFSRPGQADVTRRSAFAYDAATGLLMQERIQPNGAADEDLTTVYLLDVYGNRTAAFQCSADVLANCTSTALPQQSDGTTVHRYAKTLYDSRGRYTTGSVLPFFASSGAAPNEEQAVTIDARDEFGNVTRQHSINGLVQTSLAGALGRPYFAGDNTGKAATTTYALCSGFGGTADCGSDSMLVFRSATVSASATIGGTSTALAPTAWTYYDVLGRAVLKVSQAPDMAQNLASGENFVASCAYADAHNRAVVQTEPFFLKVNVNGADAGAPVFGGTNVCAHANYSTTTQYDVLGRVLKVTAPDKTTLSKEYLGRVAFTTNARGYTWEEVRNPLGEVSQTTDPPSPDRSTGLAVENTYRSDGALVEISRFMSSSAVVTRYMYDALGRKIRQDDPDTYVSTFTYNAAGEVIQQVDARGQTTTQSYDAQGRRWRRINQGLQRPGWPASGLDVRTTTTDTWTYDADGGACAAKHSCGAQVRESRNMQSVDEAGHASGGIAFARAATFDGLGRLDARTTSIAGSTWIEHSAYDALGRIKAQTDASGYAVAPHYTGHGYSDYQTNMRTGVRLQEVLHVTARGQTDIDQRGGTAALQSRLTYDAASGRLVAACSGNGAATGVDTAGHCTVTNSLQDLHFAWDTSGNLSARSHLGSGGAQVESFTYDALNRLTQIGVPQAGTAGAVMGLAAAVQIGYDAFGNVCTRTTPGGTQTYGYAGLAGCARHGLVGSPHAVTEVSDGVDRDSYSYDFNGNQTDGRGRHLVYDGLNQLIEATNATSRVGFQYGPDGDRFLRSDNGNAITFYLGGVEIIRDTGRGVSETRRHLGIAIDILRTDGTSETRYLYGDHLGSVDVVADAFGKKLESASFDAWGNRRNTGDWSPSATPTTLALQSTTRGFTGHEHVDDLGLIHMNGRIYDPSLGRMLQADPVQNPGSQGLNRYSYVANNPLALTDPSGHSWFSKLFREVASIGRCSV